MVEQIQKLIQKVKDEQRQLRLSEISIVRAQINPHFLYNTLDAVSALALIKDNESAYTITQALENFYRISLSSGKDVITVEDEINCIKSYVQILNIRYKDSFDVIYEIDDGMLGHSILKLILQPFVENAITHGVRNKHAIKAVGDGEITLGVTANANEVTRKADVVVLALGVRSNRALYEEMETSFDKVILVGDTEKPGTIVGAMHSANDKAFVF